LARKIEAELGWATKLERLGGGVFEVYVDGALVHSKKATGAFPDEEKLVSGLREKHA
jgi:selT/selW/selH-like putative selenoprotein